MKITKSYLKEIIKEEISNLSPPPEEEQQENPNAPAGDKTAKRAGNQSVRLADELVDNMLEKSSSLVKRLEQLRDNDQKRLALTRSVLVKIVGMEPDKIDKMLQLLVQGVKQ
tara:strand:+ start:116 stop:451 length:336 start_codon:yes stop_codon:yes gene_type:complete